MFGQRDEFIAIGIGNVHKHKASVEILSQKRAEIASFDTVNGHAIVTGVIARMDFERQIVFNSQFYTPCPAPIAKAQPHRFGNIVIRAKRRIKRAFDIAAGAFLPIEGAIVRMLGFNCNGTRRVFFKYRLHRLLKRIEINNTDTGIFGNGFLIYLTTAKPRP